MPVTKVLIPALDDAGKLKLAAGSAEPVWREVFLGRNPPDPTKTVLRFAKYFDPANAKAAPPAKVDWFSKATDALRRMYLNDQYGDCVIASKYHQVGVHTGNDSGTAAVGNDSEVLQQYHAICGPGDNGCVITDVLDAMKARGLPLSGTAHKIDGYVSVDWTNKLQVQVALDLFGGLCLGINLPSAWANGATPGGKWDVTNTGIVGGHDVFAVGYTEEGVQISTWGMVPPITITWPAFTSRKWLEECYAMLSPDWTGSDKLAPNGIDAATLASDLAILGGGGIPDVNPPGPNPPGPNPPGPNPPQPPAPVYPSYSVTLSGKVPSGLWSTLTPVTLTGTATPNATKVGIDWKAVIADALALFADISAGKWAAVLTIDVPKLLKDLGFLAARFGFGPVVPWTKIATDALTLALAIFAKNIPGAIAAAVQLLADFGIKLSAEQAAAILA